MSFFAGCLGGEDDVGDFPGVLIEFGKDLIDEYGFTGTSDTNTECMDFIVDTVLKDVLGSLGVDSRDDQAMISGCGWRFPNDAVDFFLPSLPFVFVGVDVVVEHGVVSREH